MPVHAAGLAGADRDASVRCATYLKALRQHENGHLEIARSAAYLLERRIRDLPPASACALLAPQAGQLAPERCSMPHSAMRKATTGTRASAVPRVPGCLDAARSRAEAV